MSFVMPFVKDFFLQPFPFPAPAAAPQNPSSTTLNATAIQVQWEEVPEIDQNGEIIYYEVQVDPARFQNVSYINVSGSELMLVVDGLEEFVEYSFTIRAYTIVGPGPFSVVTTNTTDQAGERSVYVNVEDPMIIVNHFLVTVEGIWLTHVHIW